MLENIDREQRRQRIVERIDGGHERSKQGAQDQPPQSGRQVLAHQIRESLVRIRQAIFAEDPKECDARYHHQNRHHIFHDPTRQQADLRIPEAPGRQRPLHHALVRTPIIDVQQEPGTRGGPRQFGMVRRQMEVHFRPQRSFVQLAPAAQRVNRDKEQNQSPGQQYRKLDDIRAHHRSEPTKVGVHGGENPEENHHGADPHIPVRGPGIKVVRQDEICSVSTEEQGSSEPHGREQQNITHGIGHGHPGA